MSSGLPASQRERIVSIIRRRLLTYREIARRFGIEESEVASIARKYGALRPYHRWTTKEIRLLKENYYELGARGMVALLPEHPNYQSIYRKAKKLGLTTRVGAYGRKRKEGESRDGRCEDIGA